MFYLKETSLISIERAVSYIFAARGGEPTKPGRQGDATENYGERQEARAKTEEKNEGAGHG